MQTVRDAAGLALGIVIIKLVFRLIPPWDQLKSLFEYGVWAGIGIILTGYIVIFVIVYLILVVVRRRKKKDVEST